MNKKAQIENEIVLLTLEADGWLLESQSTDSGRRAQAAAELLRLKFDILQARLEMVGPEEENDNGEKT